MYENGIELFSLQFNACGSSKGTVFSKERLLPTSNIWWNDLVDEIDSGNNMFFSVVGE